MTATELLTNLRTIQAAFEWRIAKGGRIRARLHNDGTKRVFDPITAVAYFRSGQFFSEGEWTTAADAISLQYSDCAEIVAACNYDWDPTCPQGTLRQHLINTLILEQRPLTAPASLVNIFSIFRKRSPSATR